MNRISSLCHNRLMYDLVFVCFFVIILLTPLKLLVDIGFCLFYEHFPCTYKLHNEKVEKTYVLYKVLFFVSSFWIFHLKFIGVLKIYQYVVVTILDSIFWFLFIQIYVVILYLVLKKFLYLEPIVNGEGSFLKLYYLFFAS